MPSKIMAISPAFLIFETLIIGPPTICPLPKPELALRKQPNVRMGQASCPLFKRMSAAVGSTPFIAYQLSTIGAEPWLSVTPACRSDCRRQNHELESSVLLCGTILGPSFCLLVPLGHRKTVLPADPSESHASSPGGVPPLPTKSI